MSATQCVTSDVLSTLSGYIGGNYSSNLNRFTKLYRVMVQASPDARLDTEAIKCIFVRTSTGDMAPIDNFITLTRVYGSESLSRFNLFPAISVYGEQGAGYSSGEAIAAIKDVAYKYLPSGFGYEFGGMSREEASSGNTTVLVFCICLAFIYLILCALYESLYYSICSHCCCAFWSCRKFSFSPGGGDWRIISICKSD